MPLPDEAITPVRRADGSGTTFIFTNYLSKVNADWKAKVGEGTAVNWPTGAGGKGNEGVAAFVQRLPNSIGYVEYAYAKQNKMTYALLQNKDGNFVAPDADNFKAAAAGADWSKTLLPGADRPAGQGRLADQRRDLHPDAQGAGQAGAARPTSLKFFDWAYANGDKMADDLDYVPLPRGGEGAGAQAWAASIKDGARQGRSPAKYGRRVRRRPHASPAERRAWRYMAGARYAIADDAATAPAPPPRRVRALGRRAVLGARARRRLADAGAARRHPRLAARRRRAGDPRIRPRLPVDERVGPGAEPLRRRW